MRTGIHFLVVLLIWTVVPNGFAEIKGERALYLSGNQTLMGCIYRPSGQGPFPAIVFNQNSSEQLNQSGAVDPFPQLAKIFVPKGYILFIPGRHSNGPVNAKGEDAKNLRRHEAYGANILGAVTWLKAQHDVDESRIAVIGEMAGAASTLFAVDQGLNVRALVLFSPAVRRMANSYPMQSRLKQAVEKCSAPIFLIQPENDINMMPKALLGPILEARSGLNQVKIYPAYGETASDAQKFTLEGCPVWQRDVTIFLAQALN